MNKKSVMTLAMLLTLPLSAYAESTLSGCAAKQNNIEQQIRYAETQGNDYRVEGLKKAHAEVIATCSDESLKKEREVGVLKKQQKVIEREQELKEATASGRTDKIAKKQAKLEEARAELKEAEAELTK
ncbi:DUF1090 domain-containing protein [Enterobacter cloacae subsp. cloacae]|jgi:hypothetical protein|uniref:DUF1090 domain-containing protein n=1 Tax=Enterobacter cloacae TaxID=550 RepID=UPI001F121D56|nr:DUF1090 domain-containing protein [Enterobacter cloacae]MDR1750054.1 DUF1090 domain-containing protein [Enterobacter cloacae]WLD30616.1 DUF1090 domain-containing protein [Enterobacter cloacae subsp. cloacae]